MLEKLKNNGLYIISFLILLLILSFNIFSYIKNDINVNNLINEKKAECLNSESLDINYLQYCQSIENYQSGDFFTMFHDTFVLGFKRFVFIIFLFVVVPCAYENCKYLKNRIVLNELSRSNMRSIKKKMLKSAYKSALILPLLALIAFLVCYIYTGSFSGTLALKWGSVIWKESTITKPILFIILYTLNLFIHSLLYINISLLILRKHHNYFVNVILAYLSFLGLEAVIEILIYGILFSSLLKSGAGIMFSISNLFTFNDYFNILSPIIVPFILLIFSFVLLYFVYKDNEKFIIDCEKNE